MPVCHDWIGIPAMRPIAAKIAMLLSFLAAAMGPQPAAAESDRDFVFKDEDGHLVLRFVGAGRHLSSSQRDEIVNAEFSSMVHDRLRADLAFDVEPIDPEWATAEATRIETFLSGVAAGFSTVTIECRSAACRIVLEHSSGMQISEHRSLLSSVQGSFQKLIEAHPVSFEPVFLMTAYDKNPQTPHIKAFLYRAGEEG
jgi:hypothetical protein